MSTLTTNELAVNVVDNAYSQDGGPESIDSISVGVLGNLSRCGRVCLTSGKTVGEGQNLMAESSSRRIHDETGTILLATE